ncbi:MAG: hypothetical protein LAP38_14385 [Acidobacteriia bacterium]|nr:hypothetical protein [Terriglobia bacterium]
MHKALVGLAALFAVSTVVGFAQPKAAIDITNAQIKEVQKEGAQRTPPAVDQQLRVVDMGKYQLAVGIIHRGATGQAAAGRGAGAGRGRGGAGRGTPANVQRCGEQASGAATGGVGGIAHDDTTETYIIVSGGGTLVTGGHIVNGVRSGPESEVTKILNGPSCSGQIAGDDVVKRDVTVGDVVIIPEGVPHGWTNIADHVDYLSVRPDMNKVLEHGYVNPGIK